LLCGNIDSCFNEIKLYCGGEKTGHVLLVNTENYDQYHSVLNRLKTDPNVEQCIHVSEQCATDGFPRFPDILSMITGGGCYALAGVSQAAMLRSEDTLRQVIGSLLELPVSGHAIVLVDHCAAVIRERMAKSLKVARKVVLLEGEASALPRIRLARSQDACIGMKPLRGMKQLFSALESLSGAEAPQPPELTVVTAFSPALFKDSAFSVTECDSVYESLVKRHPCMLSGTAERDGTEEQWQKLVSLLEKTGSLPALSTEEFGEGTNYALCLDKVWNEGDSFRKWLLWLCMKLFGVSGNRYLPLVLANSAAVSDFETHLTMDLLDVGLSDPGFERYYIERKELIADLPENLPLIEAYCDRAGRYERDAVYYLTDASEKEKYTFMRCLSMYPYSEEELLQVTKRNFPALYLYLQRFPFTSANMKLAEKDTHLREELTDYFQAYKLQKLTNRITPEFLQTVEEYAKTRPYNKMQARASIVKSFPSEFRETAQPFFFDALGLEFLAYVVAKCEEYDMIAEISVCRSELPSITVNNKEFFSLFAQETKEIGDLDDLKHHSQVIDYRKCKLPVHLFRELNIIDIQLRAIRSQLSQGIFDQAVVIADHGASRLAVIHEVERDAVIPLDEKAGHSGRCCLADSDPRIPFAAYENGFAVLADYSRFKGGRRANVEVHGGAALEEVLVPVITLSRRPKEQEICFVNPLVELRGKEKATITVYSNIPLAQPRLCVNGRFYTGLFGADQRYASFEMPELRRSKDYAADVYDGDKKLAAGLLFHVQRLVAQDNIQL